MPLSSEVFEDALDLQIGLLEAVAPTATSYPYPALQVLGREETRTFRSLVLENSFLRVVVVPALGGRIVSMTDKRTGSEILSRGTSLLPIAGGARGAVIQEGIQFTIDGESRLNASGPIDAAMVEAEEGEPAGIWLAETCGGTGISFHLHLTLPPDRAELAIEARVFNRTNDEIPCNGGFSLFLGEGDARQFGEGTSWYSAERNVGIAAFSAASFEGATFADGSLRVCRFEHARYLAPRQVDTWSLTLVPLSGLGTLSGLSTNGGVHLGKEVLRVVTTIERPGHKLLIHTSDGQTLEAPVDLRPDLVLDIPLSDLPSKPIAMVLMGPDREEVLRVDSTEPIALGLHPQATNLERRAIDLPTELKKGTFDLRTRHLAHTLLGSKAMAEGDFAGASESLEQALLYNAEDPLVWWAKAACTRLSGGETAERPELLNAHYLAPLEPILRAEAFLSQSQNMGKEPSGLVAPLDEVPENFIEVACLLIEHGLLVDATRWIDEALRHRDMHMLRYLLAYCYLVGTKMTAEAAEQVAAAARKPLAPPYPWRAVEIRALNAVVDRLGKSERISDLLDLARHLG